MKRTILMFAAAGLLIATPSCKKGENDPFMSFSGRKSRISGTWNMTAMDVTSQNTYSFGGDDYIDQTTTTYDGTTRTSTNTVTINGTAQTPSTGADTYSATHTFEKDGSYSTSETTNGNTWQANGYWSFVGKSKSADLKKKEAVMVTYTETISNGNTNTYNGTSMFPDGYWLLDRLTGKELVVLFNQNYTYSNGDTYSYTGTVTFAKG